MTEIELSIMAMKQRLQMHKETWLAAKYDAELNGRVGKALDDKRLTEAAAEQLKRALKALDALNVEEERLSELESKAQ